MENWLSELEQGVTRLTVFKGFVESNEYTEICEQYGITRGDVDTPNYRDKSANIAKFVTRCYRKTLNREPDLDGLESWCQTLIEDPNGADLVVKGFVLSPECMSLYPNLKVNVTNTMYFVNMLYETFLNRRGDVEGRVYWIEMIHKNYSVEYVSCGFIYSDEFKNLCSEYGIAVSENPEMPPEPEIAPPAEGQTMTYSGDSTAWYYNTPDFTGWTKYQIYTYYQEHSEYGKVSADWDYSSPIQNWLRLYKPERCLCVCKKDPYELIQFTRDVGENITKAEDTDGDGIPNEYLFSYDAGDFGAGYEPRVFGDNIY